MLRTPARPSQPSPSRPKNTFTGSATYKARDMTSSEAAQMIQTMRQAWPDDAIDGTQAERLFAPYSVELAEEVIADRLEADLPMPGLAELSRVLRVYAPSAAKSDPDPTPPVRPVRPWARDLPAVPPAIDSEELATRLAELRERLAAGIVRFEQRPTGPPEPVVSDLVIVPPFVRQALADGIRMRAEARKQRQESA